MTLVVFIVSAPASVMAGGIAPTWIEEVSVGPETDPVTGLTSLTASSSVVTGNLFAVDNFSDPHGDPDGIRYTDVIVDFQGHPSSTVIGLTSALWNFDPTFQGRLPLFVASFPASALPPQVDTPPDMSNAYEIDLPTGNFSPSAILIGLSGPDTGGGECFVLGVPSGNGFGPSSAEFTTIPEPSTFLLLATALVPLLVHGLYRRPSRRGAATAPAGRRVLSA
jgi:hypothetical protein